VHLAILTDPNNQGYAIIVGTSGDDVIDVSPDPSLAGYTRIDINGKVTVIRPLLTIGVESHAGNDHVTISYPAYVSAHLGAGDDTLAGGPQTDYVFGDEGNDVINGRGGNDVLRGGSGNDILLGGRGQDMIIAIGGVGADGDDTLRGDDGNDTLVPGAGRDIVLCGAGNDHVRPGPISTPGMALISGGDGNDELYGGTDADTIYGGRGDDTLIGGGGKDQLDGGPGKNMITP